LRLDYEFILVFKKPGNPPKPTPEQKKASKMLKDEWNRYFAAHWNFAGARQTGHIAAFPEELPKRLIKMFSFAGETVFDPFLGSGTTALAAEKLGRNSLGYEINEAFIPLIKEKLGCSKLNIYNAAITFARDDARIGRTPPENLPYVFRDPHKLDKKVDVKKFSFGSTIDGTRKAREDLYAVKEVLSPNQLLLMDDIKVKLIGVAPKPSTAREAIDFIKTKVRGHRVFMKFDSLKYDVGGNLLCYLYLDNKTFINAHLLRSGYAQPDSQSDYKYKKKFLEAAANA
jgi:site-specific DNA-methyltransferase (adenine-specific)